MRKPHGDRLRVALAFPNTYFVGMSNLGFQTVYKLFNAEADIVCERVFLPPKSELAEQLASGTPLVTLESQTPVARLRRGGVLGVVRVGLHERPDAAAAGGTAAARRGAHASAPARGDWRRGDVRESGAAGAVCRCHRRGRGRGARSVAAARVSRAHRIAAICFGGWQLNAAFTFRLSTT